MNVSRRILPLFLAVSVLGVSAATSDNPSPPVRNEAAEHLARAALIAGLRPLQGEVDLGSGAARVRVPDGYSFLDAADANRVLVKLWGNPEQRIPPLGLIYPSQTGLAASNTWAIVLHYDEVGHVVDTDASGIDYARVLADQQRAAGEASKDRIRDGFPSIEVVRWASPPRYDGVSHKFHWAKELRFGGSERFLNYNVRLLGRRGMLVLNAVAPIARFSEIESAFQKILGVVEFQPGHRYADFEPGKDRVASRGLEDLVAGRTEAGPAGWRASPNAIRATEGILGFVLVGGIAFLWRRSVFTGRR